MSKESSDVYPSPIWFSHFEDRYNADVIDGKKVFCWTRKPQVWDWSNCNISWIRKNTNALKIVIRSANSIFSKYRKKEVTIRFMLGFDVDGYQIEAPKAEEYREPLDNLKQEYGKSRTRWIVRLDKDHSIWQWKEQDQKVESSQVYTIYKNIVKSLKDEPPIIGNKNLFNVTAGDENKIGRKIVPVVYQPALDSWKNFIREVHCHRVMDGGGNPSQTIQVTILFNNEQLREYRVANRIYEWFRSWFYGRTIDVESFNIMLNGAKPESFDFPAIYSGENDIQKDSIHLQKQGVIVKYYFGNDRHPIIFINTSNHAMGEHDTNHRLWKWEYLAWSENGPIDFGEQSRDDIERRFRPKLKLWNGKI